MVTPSLPPSRPLFKLLLAVQEERDDALQRFRSGETPVLVATEVAARGLDVPGVSTVLVYDFPPEFLQYVHRIGRTGRAGAKGSAVCFFTPRHRRHAPALVQMMRDAQCPVPVGERGARLKCAKGDGVWRLVSKVGWLGRMRVEVGSEYWLSRYESRLPR